MVAINPIGFILLGQLIFLAIIDASYKPVNFKVINGDEIIELNWQPTEQQLANQNLPIWIAEKNKEPWLKNMIMENENLRIYHDLEKSSAAIYFTSHCSFFGNIDTRFYIVGLPLSNIESKMYQRVGDGYIFAREKNKEYFHEPSFSRPFQFDFHVPLTSSQDELSINPLFTQPHRMSLQKKISSTVLYPEILVFLPHDVYHGQLDINISEQLIALIRLHLIYFNSVDMLLGKLAAATNEISIRLNIAGFVIETKPGVFPLVHNNDSIDALETTMGFTKYIRQHRRIFVEDSFDFYFISTNHKIQSRNSYVAGTSTPSYDIYKFRLMNMPFRHLSGAIVRQIEYLGDFIAGAHEIAHLLEIEHDPPEIGTHMTPQYYGPQCSAVMKRSNGYCQNCLKWSEYSIKQLKSYISESKNHCYLLNYPRSLNPYGFPVMSLDPEDQCMCYGFDKYNLHPLYMVSIPPNMCTEPLRCSVKEQIRTPLPLDGTPCDGTLRVCWQKQCIPVMESSGFHLSI